ncbi:hypothetical protein GJU40_18810 [Bacillus lacus]|uniref:DUF4025 domain-containing protein n=1 Tax=Metabacillus lacus TaxID=1983721 RepID=A0A7X2J2C0_9BACI|nr:hypothetical protein [Metabacillus lacus]MRX74176.1 hypothetical protein [Metabacillus lacus]
MKKELEDIYTAQATKKQEITIQTDGSFPNKQNIAGDSVDAHKEQELANSIIGGEEIEQQNKNL